MGLADDIILRTGPFTPPGASLIGAISPFAGSTPPQGWLLCDGSAVNRTTYQDLFYIIGTTYGPGDGVNTFNLPDLRGRTCMGYGAGAGLTPRTLTDNGGEEGHILTIPELPAHAHARGYASWASDHASTAAGTTPPYVGMSPGSTGNAGNDEAHNNMHPFQASNFIIKT